MPRVNIVREKAVRWKAFRLAMMAAALLLCPGLGQAQEVDPSAPGSPTISPTVSPSQTPDMTPAVKELKKLSLEQLMDLDVTSVSKQPQPYGQAPAAIDVITNDEIRRSGASSIPEALRLADNLEVAQKNSHDWSISSRGFNTDLSNKLLVLMDGRSVYTPLFAGVIWDIQDYLLEDIDHIEVISGPGGTLWGANAVNGVINITSKSAKDTQGLYVEGGGGLEQRDFGGARYGGALGSDAFYRVYGKYFDRGDEVFPNGSQAPDSWSMGQGGFRIDAQPSSEETFTFQGDYYSGDENEPTVGETKDNGGNLLGRWSLAFADDSDMSLQLYYDHTYLNDPVAADVIGGNVVASSGTLTDTLDTYDIDFQHRFHLTDGNNLIWGLGYRVTHDVDLPAPGLAFDPSTLDQGLFNVFAQDEMTLAKDLSFIFGSKLEHNDYTGFEVEPSARLKWDLNADQMVWAAVSRAVRMPSRVDRDERILTPGLAGFGIDDLLIGGADFVSETVVTYELGYRAQLTKEFSTSISTFFNNYDNIRSAALSPPPTPLGLGFPVIFQNNLEAQTGGIELTTDYQVLTWWRLHGGYDLLEESLWVKPGETDINNALNETADPKNQVFLRSSMDLPGNLELDPAFRWVDSLIYNVNGVPGIVPSYAELDVRLGWHVAQNIELSVTGQNLLHDHHLEYVISGSSPQEQIQRNVYGKLTCQF
jgi:iron complex outermembrane recepter protein